MNAQALRVKVAQNKTRLIIIAAVALGILWSLSDTLPGLIGNHLPAVVEDAITRRYTTCIKSDDTPIQYNEARQPECGRVDIRVVGEGTVQPEEQARGITRAICYRVFIQNPFWTTLATTRHEVIWKSRTASKVTILQNGAWQVFPDQSDLDEQRWSAHSCSEPYDSATGEASQVK